MSAYSLIPSIDAVYKVIENKASIMPRSEAPVKVENAFVGAAELDLSWFPPKSAKRRWRTEPTMASEDSISVSVSDIDDGSHLIELLIDDVFPAFGFVKEDCTGFITAPAIRFECSVGPSFWAILLHSGWVPPKPALEVPALSVAAGRTRQQH